MTEFCSVQNSLYVQLLPSPILAALLHDTPAAGVAKLCGVVQGMELRNFRRGRHLYSAGRPSRWASAHILVFILFSSVFISRKDEQLNTQHNFADCRQPYRHIINVGM